MLESHLKIDNFHWSGDAFRSPLEFNPQTALAGALRGTDGRFSVAFPMSESHLVMARDKLGMNKLFFAVSEEGRVITANYLIDLVKRGVPPEAVFSVPAGHVLDLDLKRQSMRLEPYADIRPGEGESFWPRLVETIRDGLETWFSRLAGEFGDRPVCVCLSGGLDSGVVAALARRYFGDVTAYTYGYSENGESSEDAEYGEKIASALGIPFRFVPASREDVLGALDDALCYGQDWRDFNVHCAVVNEILAKAVAADARERGQAFRPLVLTGDLMNEYLADYSSVFYRGKEYYRLPRVEPNKLRIPFIRGLDAGDREVGVFAHHGVDLVQPYAMMVDEYLQVPGSYLDDEQCKQDLVKDVAGDLLPSFFFDRKKVRAQIGNPDNPTGVLPVLAERGYEAGWLKQRFQHLMGIEESSFMNQLIRLGRYRFPIDFPDRRQTYDGYYTG